MSLHNQLQAELGAAYRIDRELTGGGMSRVFVATEVALERSVVVKVLRPELAASVTAERFSREIQLAARLQQANIVPLLTAGRTGELPFYTMPFVDGLSLRQRIVEHGPLPIDEAIGVLRDVARALVYAHDAGVVHRDIKPENILLSGGAAVVTDFGIAKAISVSRTDSSAATLTQAGVGVGTPAYMAPEQATSDPKLDHRADIYAFGCVAYELFTGQAPFRSAVIHEVIAAHMTQAPAPVRRTRPDTPPALATLVERCLEKSPDRRPQSARELVDALNVASTTSSVSRALGLASRRGVIIGVMVVAVFVVVAVIAYLAPMRRAPGAETSGEPSIVVIPFVNVGGDSAQDYLADGVSDDLATAVGKLPGVHLAARSAAYRFRGRRDIDVRELGKTLHVNFVVQGTLRRLADSLRISAQVSDAASGRELWSDNFDRSTKDVFRTQDDIVAAVVTALRERVQGSTLERTTTSPVVAQGTTDADAYYLYLEGEHLLRARQVDAAADRFQRAIWRDTGFARAYAGLSHTLGLMPYFSGVPVADVLDRIVNAADHALARDSTLAEAHMSRGVIYMQVYRWDDAAKEFERALALDSNDVQTRFQAGRYFYNRGNEVRALAEFRRAQQIDPFSALAASWMSYVFAFQGRTAEAVAEMRRAITYDSNSAVVKQLSARVFLQAKQPTRAREFADRLPNAPPWSGTRAFVYGSTGDSATALGIVRAIEAKTPRPWFANTAISFAYLGLRDTIRALAALERATDARETWPTWNRPADPIFDPIRNSGRWAKLLRRVGF